MNLIRLATVGATVLSGCASAPAATDSREALLRTDREWSSVASEGNDVERIVSYWTDDAIVTPPDAPAIGGKAAIRSFVSHSLAVPGFKISWTPKKASVSSDGSMGYTTGTNSTTFPRSDGKLTTVEGRYGTVWRRDSSGAWKCVADIWNSGPAL